MSIVQCPSTSSWSSPDPHHHHCPHHNHAWCQAWCWVLVGENLASSQSCPIVAGHHFILTIIMMMLVVMIMLMTMMRMEKSSTQHNNINHWLGKWKHCQSWWKGSYKYQVWAEYDHDGSDKNTCERPIMRTSSPGAITNWKETGRNCQLRGNQTIVTKQATRS